MDKLPDLPTLRGISKDGWEPAAMGSAASIHKLADMLQLMGMAAGVRRFQNGWFLWKRHVLPGEEVPPVEERDPGTERHQVLLGPSNTERILTIEEYRRATMRAPLGNEEGGYSAYEEVDNVES